MYDIQYYQNKLDNRYKKEKLVLVDFVGYKKPCKIKCLECGNIYGFVRFSDAIKNSKKFCCKICGKQKHILEKFKQSLKDKIPNEKFEIISFKDTQSPLIIECGKCGERMTFMVADSLKNRKHICRKCYPLRDDEIKKTREEFKKYISKSKEWTLVQSLENTHAMDFVSCRCNYCNKINKKNMYDYMRGIQCSCKRRSNVRDRVQQLLGKEYEIVEGGYTVESKVSLRHSCGFIYSVSVKSILSGYGLCPKCKRTHSKGERIIKNFLEEHNIEYYNEYPKVICGHVLRFDFFIPSKNMYIEFQGKQHYIPVDYFGGEDTLKKQKEYDNLKRKFCKDNLLEISYLDIDNIEEILIHEFNDQDD